MHKNYQIEIPNGEKFLKELNTKPFVQIDGANIFEPGYDCKPFAEFNEIENFPNCCEYHSSVKNQLDDWFLNFPDCCEAHREIAKKKWFKKENYNNLPVKILKHIEYTENFISESIEKENWYKEITDYIQYNIDSFGIPNIGGTQYYSSIKNWVEKTKPTSFDFPNWKRKQLLEFLENLANPISKPKTDLNILYSIFQKWLKTFPSLPYFIRHKEKLKGKFPINYFLYEPEFNRFSGETKFKCRTQGELVELLILITKESLKSINTPELLEKKLISSKEKYEIDLLNQEHILTQNKLLTDYSKREAKYFKIIKKWLANEKKYIKLLKPLLAKNQNLSLENIPKSKNEVFITYSWDNENHKDKVLSLNNFLRDNGFNSEIDRFKAEQETALDFRKMMHSIITDYPKVLVVLSKGYKEKANNFKSGVGIEYEMIIKDFDNSPNKYILVSFCDLSDDIMPVFFREKEVLDLRQTENQNILFSKLKDESIIEFSKVAEKKPVIKKKKIENFNDLINKPE